MSIKQSAKSVRDALQQGIYWVINPFVRFLIKIGVTPNMVTAIGFLGAAAATALVIWAGYDAGAGADIDYKLLTVAGILSIAFSLFDMLDGQVARIGGKSSRFGAMFDSVLDRYGELVTLGGIAYYLMQVGMPVGGLITFLALVGSLMVSYVRARGEGLGVVCKIGFMQRPERVVVTNFCLLATGICGQAVESMPFNPNYILIAAMAFIALFANITAIARIIYCKKALQNEENQQ